MSQQVLASIGATATTTLNALVAGAGSASVNGLFTERGTSGGKPYYNLDGSPDDEFASVIKWFNVNWFIIDSGGSIVYESSDAVAFPWLVTTWAVGEDGSPPAPTVVETP